MLSKQEIFDKVATHLLTQKKSSIHDDGNCLYHDKKTGRRCAIGCLFNDEFDTRPIEGIAVDMLFARGVTFANNSPGDILGKQLIAANVDYPVHEHLLRGLQEVHDSLDPLDWVDGLYDLARHDANLNLDVLKEKSYAK